MPTSGQPGYPPSRLFTDYALTAFELGVRDYLLKPVSAQRLSQCLERIRPLLSAARSEGAAKSPARLSIKCGNEYRLIDPARTVRVEAAGNFSIVYSEESEIFASESMKYLQQRLVPFGFVRAHKSHLVNIRYVSSVSTVHIRLLNGHPVPLGRAYRAAVAEVLGHSRCTT
jgi:DNA-binding LytR/AlgR family response regulator